MSPPPAVPQALPQLFPLHPLFSGSAGRTLLYLQYPETLSSLFCIRFLCNNKITLSLKLFIWSDEGNNQLFGSKGGLVKLRGSSTVTVVD